MEEEGEYPPEVEKFSTEPKELIPEEKLIPDDSPVEPMDPVLDVGEGVVG